MKIHAYSWVAGGDVEFNAGVRLVGPRYAASRSAIRKAFAVPKDAECYSEVVAYVIIKDSNWTGHVFHGDVKHVTDGIFIGCMQFTGIDYKRLKRWATAKKSQKSSK